MMMMMMNNKSCWCHNERFINYVLQKFCLDLSVSEIVVDIALNNGADRIGHLLKFVICHIVEFY